MASHPTQPNEQRRRLLKAASAAPVIFTLPVGSSVAAGSVQCELMNNTITGTTEKFGTLNIGDSVQATNPDTGLQQDYVVEHIYDNGNYNLVTGSCWSSLNPSASAGSSTHIV